MREKTKTPEERKAESVKLLKSRGVPVIDHLPLLESEEDTRLRSPSEVAKRVICLVFAADFAQGHADKVYWQYIKTHALQEWFTPKEWEFVNSKRPDEQTKVNMSWKVEGAYLLLWAMGRIGTLPFPVNPVDSDAVYRCLPPFDESPCVFVKTATLISKSDILDKSDLIYRMHWATRQASLREQEMPAGLQSGVVQEWHHAINWLTCCSNEAWDEVTTDT
jgi:hypothetical protein